MKLLDDLIADNPGWNATEIDKKMRTALSDRNDLPTLRTVQSYVKENRPHDPTGPWEPTEWSGEDVSLVLELVKYLGETEQLIWPTRREADHILWIKQTAPTLPLELTWRLTHRRIIHEAQQLPAQRIGWYLAFKPWQNGVNKDLYFKMVPERERIMYPIEARGTLRGEAIATVDIQRYRTS
jgi:hypothetical protein